MNNPCFFYLFAPFGVFVDLCDLDYKEPEIPDDMFTN